MKQLLLIILTIFAGYTSLHARQLAFTFETHEGKPVKYAMVKIAEQGKFYICDANGRIQFEGQPGVNMFTLEVSALNIRDTTMQIERIPGKEHYTVTLQEEEFLLPEFTKDEGREFKRRSRKAGFTSVIYPIGPISYTETKDSLHGLESATLIENNAVIMLEEIALRIHELRIDTFYLGFNVRVRKVDSLPGDKVFPSDIIVPITEDGWLKLDVSERRIFMESDFYLTYTFLSEPELVPFDPPKWVPIAREHKGKQYYADNMSISAKVPAVTSKTWVKRPQSNEWEHSFINPLIYCRYRELR